MNAKRFLTIGVLVAALSPVLHDAAAQTPTIAAPALLRDTGLYAPDVVAFSPQYPLWSDGAKKRRWISIPQGAFIDASRPDAWEFPRGTRLWKEFSVGRPIETRLIERLQDGSWRYSTYIWDEAGTDAVLAGADGATVSAGERRYTIPSVYDCRACHDGSGAPVLGFTALQLSSDRDPLAPHAEPAEIDLRALVARGWLRNLPKRLLDTPPRIEASSPTERAALGYLHANCGHCHSKPDASGAAVPVAVRLAQGVVEPDSSQPVLQSLLSTRSRFRSAGAQQATHVVLPGASHASVLPLRMRSRDPRVQMPPLGTDIPDSEALALIERWIDSLKPVKEPKP